MTGAPTAHPSVDFEDIDRALAVNRREPRG
jgi:hypothetical protein